MKRIIELRDDDSAWVDSPFPNEWSQFEVAFVVQGAEGYHGALRIIPRGYEGCFGQPPKRDVSKFTIYGVYAQIRIETSWGGDLFGDFIDTAWLPKTLAGIEAPELDEHFRGTMRGDWVHFELSSTPQGELLVIGEMPDKAWIDHSGNRNGTRLNRFITSTHFECMLTRDQRARTALQLKALLKHIAEEERRREQNRTDRDRTYKPA